MKNFALLALICALLTPSISAQALYVYDGGTPGIMSQTYTPSAGYPFGTPSPFGPLPLPLSGALAPGAAGGMCIDQTTSTVYLTDGFAIITDANSAHPVFVPPTPPVPAPVLLGGGPITGMACDSAGGVIWMTDGISIGSFTIGAPFAPVTPPVPVVGLAAGPLSGMDFEPSTGTLWGCTAVGAIHNFFVTGLPVGASPLLFVPPFSPFPFTALAVNTTDGVGSIGAPFCSTQIPAFHISITDGLAIFDVLGGGAFAPIPLPFAAGRGPVAMAFSSDNQYLPGAAGCLSSGAFPVGGWSKATHTGAGGLNSVGLVGATPGTTALLLYDVCPIPGGAFVPMSGETLWCSPFSPDFTFYPAVTDATGSALLFADLTFAPAGFQFTMQWAVLDPMNPLGYCFSDAFIARLGLQ